MNIGVHACSGVSVKVLVQKQKHRSIDRVENPEINPHTYDQLIYNKGGKQTQWEKTVSSIIGAWKTGQLYVKIKVGHFLMPYTK